MTAPDAEGPCVGCRHEKRDHDSRGECGASLNPWAADSRGRCDCIAYLPEPASWSESATASAGSGASPARDGDTRLAEIAARAATPGPWHIEESHWDIPGCTEVDRIVCGPDPRGVPRDGIADVFDGHWVDDEEEPGPAPNLQFIAAARTDVPYLLGEVERLRAELADVSHDLEHVVQERAAAYEQGKQVGRLNGNARREKAEAERDVAVAALNRVRQLCDEAVAESVMDGGLGYATVNAHEVLAAADVPEARDE